MLSTMCPGPIKRVCHWGPLLALGIVKSVSVMSLHCCMMWWPPMKTIGGLLNILIFSTWNVLVLYNFFSAMYVGPGHVPIGWIPENPDDSKYLQYCEICKGYKAPRAHHCRKCKRCVMKMDHHCPWINNCCGHRNHANFVLFLIFAVCGCIHASVILGCSLYRALYKNYYRFYGVKDPVINLGLPAFVFGMFSFGMALGVIIAVGALFVVQIRGIMKNETGIENWIVAKANRPHHEGDVFVYPYYLGWKKNLQQVFTWSGQPQGDGLHWTVIEGCDQYALTREQQKQKEEKRQRTREYTIIEDYEGSWFPITKGVRVVCTLPCSDEPRIPMKEGDKVLVTRWRRHWLYGEKWHSDDKDDIVRCRGWFPRKCAVEIINGDNDSHKKIIEQRNKKRN